MRVGVVGAAGRMGREVCQAVLGDPELELVAAVDVVGTGAVVPDLVRTNRGEPGSEITISSSLEVLSTAGCEVVVDFTRVEAARLALPGYADAGIHAVVGTTGFGPDDLAALSRRFSGPDGDPPGPNCIVAPNFAIGAVLMMRFAELAAPWFDGAEIIELHHAEKRDAPSGTAMSTAARMASARNKAFDVDRTETEILAGARGGFAPGGVRVHSVRLPGLVAHQEVVLGAPGETLSIRHDSNDRSSFMNGVILAVKAVPERPGLTLGLDAVLGL